MKKIIWLVVLVLVLIVIYSVSAPKKFDENAAPIKIGFIAPLTGDAAAIGEQFKRVVDYRVADINSKAKEGEPKFEAAFEDGQCSGSVAVNAFQKLTDVSGVKFISTLCSTETLTIAPLANEKKVVLLSPISSNPKVEDQGPFTFSLSYSDKKTTEDMAKAASAYKRVAIISEQADYNIGIRDGVTEFLKQYPSVSVVASETLPKGTTDFRSALAKIRATSPDAVILNPFLGATAENLIKQLAEMKTWTGYKLITTFVYLSDNARAAVGNFTEGMIVVDVPTLTAPDFVALSTKIETEKGTLKDLGNYYTASTIDTVDLLTSLIAKFGNDPVAVQKELSTGSFKGFIGDINFGGNNFVRFDLSGTYIIKDGKAALQ